MSQTQKAEEIWPAEEVCRRNEEEGDIRNLQSPRRPMRKWLTYLKKEEKAENKWLQRRNERNREATILITEILREANPK